MTGNKTTYKLATSTRTTGISAQNLREQGLVPVELYSHKEDNIHLQVKANEFIKVFVAAGESALIDLKIDDKDAGKILVKDIQLDPVKDKIIHADFYKININEKLTADIPLVFTGLAPAVKELGGILVKQVDSVHTQCLPADLVHEIAVDLSGLATFNDSILIKDLQLPEGIEILNDLTVLVASVTEPRKIEDEAPVEAENETATTGEDKSAVVGETEKSE